MKMKILEFRCMIRSILSEAPLADVYPPSMDSNINYEPEGDKRGKEPVRKFFSTPKFAADAKKIFSLWSIPVYLVPAYKTQISDYGFTRHKRVTDTASQAEVLRDLRFSEKEIDKLLIELKKGACIIVTTASRLVKNFLPSPWMTIHALLDDQRDQPSPLSTMVENVYNVLISAFESSNELNHVLTMKSARTNNLNSMNDAAAEIICQAGLTSSGFRYNMTNSAEKNAALERIAGIVQSARRELENFMKGNIVSIATYSFI